MLLYLYLYLNNNSEWEKKELINSTCYTNYTFEENNKSLSIKNIDKKTLYKEEFTYEYEFKKKDNSNYIFVVYTNYNGTELIITHLGTKSSTIIFAFLGILVVIIILIICFCFCWYKICKKRKNDLDNGYDILDNLEYKYTIEQEL